MSKYLKQALNLTIPKFNELILYLNALICFILFFVHPEFRSIYFDILSGGKAGKAGLGFIAIGILATLGLFLSVYHVLAKRKKTDFEKLCMGVFILCVNGLAGIISGIETITSQPLSMVFFPLWNITSGAFLLYQIGLQRFDVTDDNASPLEVICGSILLLTIYFILTTIPNLSWAMTFSICMCCISTVISTYYWGKTILHQKN
jgi:hypothetical protein